MRTHVQLLILAVTSPMSVSLINGKVTQNRTSLQETTLTMAYIVTELGHPFAEFRRGEVMQRPETRAPKGITSLSLFRAVARVLEGRVEQTYAGVVKRPRQNHDRNSPEHRNCHISVRLEEDTQWERHMM
jgi:hypothetical protein